MARTRLQMATEVLDNMGRSSTGTTRSGETLADMAVVWLNRAQRRIARKLDVVTKQSTASTVASQARYSFPSNLRSLYSLRCENGLESIKLKRISRREFNRLVPKPDELTEDQPLYYIVDKPTNTFELYPIPDAAYTLRMDHSVWPTDIAADGDNSDFHDVNVDIDDILIYWATEEGYNYLQEFVDARVWRARGKEALDEVIEQMNERQDWEPQAKGFTTRRAGYIGEYYNDPFVITDPSTRWL